MNVYPIRCSIRAEAGLTRVDVYDDIGEGGWFSEGLTAKDFAASVAGLKGSLEVHINSGGGDVFDGIAIGNALRAHKGRVTTVVDGIAASIASVIAQAGQDRIMQPGSMMMIHDAFGGCVGDAAEMAKMAQTLDEVSDNIASIYASRTGRPAEQWRSVMRQEQWYTADKAVENGLADRVGDGAAELPAGLDLAAFSQVPGRIAAAMRKLPQAEGRPRADSTDKPITGPHSHSHPSYGEFDDDGDGVHVHEHEHHGEEPPDHHHSHDGTHPIGHAHPHIAGGQQSCADMGHQCCRDAAAAKDMLRALIREEIAAAASARFLNEKYSQADRDAMAKSGEAMPDGSYPIRDEEDLHNAIHAVGRGGSDHDAIRRHIIKRAKALGKSDAIPDNWNADGSAGDGDADDRAGIAVTDDDLEQFRAALRGATA